MLILSITSTYCSISEKRWCGLSYFCYVFSFVYNPLHAVRRAMEAASPLP